MKLSGLIFMLFAWTCILGMDVFCFYRIFTKQKGIKEKHN